MLKNILKLKGAKEISKNQQKSINGGLPFCNTVECPPGYFKSCEGKFFRKCIN